MKTVLDAETTVQLMEKVTDGSPYNPSNHLVSVGLCNIYPDNTIGPVEYSCCNHSTEPTTADWKQKLQATLSQTEVLICHNVKFDLSWLLECGFDYTGTVYDTMITEYVLSRGQTRPLNLSSCCKRRGLPVKDDKEVKDYISKGIWYYDMPWEIVEKYGITDVDITAQLYLAQQEELSHGT